MLNKIRRVIPAFFVVFIKVFGSASKKQGVFYEKRGRTENRNLSDDEFALLMGCSGTLRGGSCPGEERNCSIGAGSGYLRNRQDTFQSSR